MVAHAAQGIQVHLVGQGRVRGRAKLELEISFKWELAQG